MVIVSKKRTAISLVSQKQLLINKVKKHKAWKGSVSLSEIGAMLEGHPSFTYVVSEGMDECHFFLSFVDTNQIVKYKSLRIVLDRGNWVLINAMQGSYESLDDLVPNCLRCSVHVCKPLANEEMQKSKALPL